VRLLTAARGWLSLAELIAPCRSTRPHPSPPAQIRTRTHRCVTHDTRGTCRRRPGETRARTDNEWGHGDCGRLRLSGLRLQRRAEPFGAHSYAHQRNTLSLAHTLNACVAVDARAQHCAATGHGSEAEQCSVYELSRRPRAALPAAAEASLDALCVIAGWKVHTKHALSIAHLWPPAWYGLHAGCCAARPQACRRSPRPSPPLTAAAQTQRHSKGLAHVRISYASAHEHSSSHSAGTHIHAPWHTRAAPRWWRTRGSAQPFAPL